ncbi:MAG: carboxypeptidase regulatory-like domain-containing protein [Bryobacteraceae bacterium]
MKQSLSISLLCLAASSALAQAPAREDPGRIPVKRVVLYKNGVGFFEHVGTVHGNEAVSIAFTSGQLNDVLKSLTVLDLNGGHIAGVSYGSSEPAGRQLDQLHLPVGDKPTLSDFLGGLRGARLEVRSGTNVITGRLLSIERKTRVAGGATLEVDYLALMGDNGELRTTELSPAYSVRLLDHDLASKVDRYLDIESAARDADIRRMVVSTEGSGARSLYLSYISEVPVWKSTYRIVLDSKHGTGALLQGWAVVDNTVGEDWNNVELSLVAGAPQSFIQNLSQPYYAHRPVVPIPELVSTTPQTFEATLIPGSAQLSGIVTDSSGAVIPNAEVKAFAANNALVGRVTTNAAGIYEFAQLPEGPTRLEIASPGFRSNVIGGVLISDGHRLQQNARLEVGGSAETVQVTASAPTFSTDGAAIATNGRLGNPRVLGSGNGLGRSADGNGYAAGHGGGQGGGSYRIGDALRKSNTEALSRELGDLFEYKLKDPITIPKNRSALVPIAQSPITAEKVSLWNDQSGLLRPQRALWLTNSTGLTLDGGSVSVLEDETFAGEGIFDPIRPGERRLVSYANDLAVIVSSKIGSERERVSRVIIDHGTLRQNREVREKKVYTLRNSDKSPRTLIVEHPVRPGYELRGTAKPDETTADWYRFRVKVDAGQTAALEVEEARVEQSTYAVSNINAGQLTMFLQLRSIDASVEAAIRKVLAHKTAIDALQEQKSNADDETQSIFDDQKRLRENMKALKGTPEEKALVQRYTAQLDHQETRLAQLQKRSNELDNQIDAAQEDLNKFIEQLSFDVKL